MEFGERLKELRTRLNYSQKEISEKTGLTIRTIQRIENNEVKPSLHSLRVLGEALQTDLTEVGKSPEAKPYEFNFTIKITDMNQFLIDLKTLVKTHLENHLSCRVSDLLNHQLHRHQSRNLGWLEREVTI